MEEQNKNGDELMMMILLRRQLKSEKRGEKNTGKPNAGTQYLAFSYWDGWGWQQAASIHLHTIYYSQQYGSVDGRLQHLHHLLTVS